MGRLAKEVFKVKEKIKIIGFGNIYMKDDGVGVRVIEEIKEQGIFNDYKNIEMIDGGTSGFDLIFFLQQADKVIIIDAIDAGQKIGEIVTFGIDQVIDEANLTVKSFTLHDISLKRIFEIVRALKIGKDLRVIGIHPKEIDRGEGLSPQIRKKIPEIILLVKKETGIQ